MTAPASSILARLREVGGTLSVVGGQLVIEAPEGAVGGELLGAIKAHKADVLDLLDEQDRWPEGVPDWLAGIMDGPVAHPDVGTIGFRSHLARIKRFAASFAETRWLTLLVKRMLAIGEQAGRTEVTRPTGGPIRVVDVVPTAEKIALESPCHTAVYEVDCI